MLSSLSVVAKAGLDHRGSFSSKLLFRNIRQSDSLVNEFESWIGTLILVSKPYQISLSDEINQTHHRNLRIALGDVYLIDTNCIYPDGSHVIFLAEMQQGISQICCDTNRVIWIL